MGGVISGTNKAEAEWISHSFDVFFEKKPACRLTDKMWMNHRNTVSMAGLCQPDLSDDDLHNEICKKARDCYEEHCNRLKSKNNPDGKYTYYRHALKISCEARPIMDDIRNQKAKSGPRFILIRTVFLFGLKRAIAPVRGFIHPKVVGGWMLFS